MIALAPEVTPAPIAARNPDIIDKARSEIDGLVDGLRSDVSAVYTVIDGVSIPGFLQGLPDGEDVKKQLGIDDDDDDLAAQPTQVLNLPYVSLCSSG